MAQVQDDDAQWSSIGSIMMVLLCVQFGLTIAAASGVLPLVLYDRNMFAYAAALAIGTMLIALRCRMPRWAKAGGSIVIATGLLTLAATQDLFGIRTLNAKVSGAINGEGAPPDRVEMAATADPGYAIDVAIHPAHARDDNGFADLLSQDVANDDVRSPRAKIVISGATDYRSSPDGDTYSLNWSIRRGPEAKWCGRTSIMTAQRAVAIDAARETIARAIEASLPNAARCDKQPESSG